MAAGLGLFGAEGGTEAVDAAKGVDIRLVVQLARLGQVGRLAEVIGLEKGGRALAGGWGQDRRVHIDEAVIVEPIADGADDGSPHPQHGPLPLRADPQVAVVHQELDPVLLGLNGVVLGHLEHAQAGDAQFITAGDARGPVVLADSTGDDEG